MSTFTETLHPRGAGGKFVASSLPEPAVALAAADPVQERRLVAARYVLAEYTDLEIMDHSPARRDTVTLGELGDPALALGNCWAATNELIEQAGAAEFEAEWVDELTIRRTRLGGQHVALLVGDLDGLYMADYTIRQFNPELPFPYVAGVEDWKRTVEEASGCTWDFADED